ncbi:hypothetical protein DL768_010696 [Monosporascus sp. mg162]|nr:hypothetical protein DL768_010696 [Monosporascus sp. mg162]
MPQGFTNSVAHFCRMVGRILHNLMPDVARPFVDDVTVKGPKTKYNEEEIFPGIRRFVYKHIVNINKTLLNCELASATITKVVKILKIQPCKNVSEVKAFLSIVVYYRIFVTYFAIKTEPLIRLLRRNQPFIWGPDQDRAMESVKKAITTAPTLITLDYGPEAGKIIVRTDASKEGFGGTLGQLINGVEHPARFESGTWKGAELNYDAGKLECRAVLKILRRFRNHIYGVRFVLETDAKVLVAQINDLLSSLPGAVLIRWVAWIKMFDFEIRHIPGKKNLAADGLFRKLPGAFDALDDQWEGEVDDFIDVQLNVIRLNLILTRTALTPTDTDRRQGPFIGNWSEESQKYARFLTTLDLPDRLSTAPRRKRNAFKAEALNYFVQDGILWRKANKRYGSRRVVDTEQKRLARGMFGHVREAVFACVKCQKAADRRFEEGHGFSQPIDIAVVWVIDVQFMPNDDGCKATVEARCELSNYLETKALRSVTSAAIKKFLDEHVFYRHGIPIKIKIDGGSENKGEVIEACNALGIKRKVGAAYAAWRQGLVERGYVPIAKALMKVTNGTGKGWAKLLPKMVFADNTTVKSYGLSPYELLYGQRAFLPIETVLPTWRIMTWDPDTPREDLIAQRIRLLERKAEDVAKATKVIADQRRKAARLANERDKNKIRDRPLEVNDLPDDTMSDISDTANVEPPEDWQPRALEPVRTNIEVQIPSGRLEGYTVIDDSDTTETIRSGERRRSTRLIARN